MKQIERPAPGMHGVGDRHRRFGRDELNLADWKIGVATYQQPIRDDGRKLDRFTTVIQRGDGTCQRVTREAPSSVGLPTAADDDVVLALHFLTFRNRYESDVVRCEPSEILKILGWPANATYRRRLKDSIERLTKVSITYTDAWFDRDTLAIAPEFFTGILAEAKLLFRRGRPEKGSKPESYFQWVDSLFQSMKSGNLATIDLDFHFSLRKPGAGQLHRHLNKRRYGIRRYQKYERDLKELACSHLGMQDCKDLKRNFHSCVQELIDAGYLPSGSVEYVKVRPGTWRVRFNFQEDKSAAPPPIALVRKFYELWCGDIPNRLSNADLIAAREVIGKHGEQLPIMLVPRVVDEMKVAFPNAKAFGATRRYFDEAATRPSVVARRNHHRICDRREPRRRGYLCRCDDRAFRPASISRQARIGPMTAKQSPPAKDGRRLQRRKLHPTPALVRGVQGVEHLLDVARAAFVVGGNTDCEQHVRTIP